ncbi:LON peptidase substrate-binding domain-containing protein [Dictyobacter arantiisoli]|uniref:ATP-dependent protease n=1 Tax=Dictyobacter arantiisoli TaxID=2014874 RepID=A0A5A5T8L8_9CHLR|nr:LON peptidase substrate-binding domain-containing protein [Dictyobacter arantiisoli]GCF07821.1 ATP-dependent protease [Dictyobacter arantiisoli]
MSTAAIELPLFPLNVVLFPGTVLPLHIFELRYRQMVIDCQREDKPFGIVLAKAGSTFMHEETHEIGTLAEIHSLHKLEDGGYDLMAVGLRRFRIVSQHHDKPYLSGWVEPFEDVAERDEALDHLVRHARNLFITYLNMLLEAPDENYLYAKLPESPENLSHFIAYFLEIEDIKKQRYLELHSTQQRFVEEIAVLRREIPLMRYLLFKKPGDDVTMLN